MPLSREQILAMQDSDVEEFDVPEWNDSVYLRVWSGRERDKFESEFSGEAKNGKLVNIRAAVASLSVCDEKGARLFTEADILKLGDKSAAALDRIFSRALRKNHILQADQDQLLGNSQTGQKGPSGSG